MRTIKWIIAGGIVLTLSVALTAGYLFFLRPFTVPVYRFEPGSAAPGEVAAATLFRGDLEYVDDRSSLSLSVVENWFSPLALMGRTEEGMRIYAIRGQDSRDYIVMTGEMMPAVVFRNADLPPVDLRTLAIDRAYLLQKPVFQPPRFETADPAIINEVRDTLTLPRDLVLLRLTPHKAAFLRLSSDRLAGLHYTVYAYADEAGMVYLAEFTAPEDWIPAGPAFSAWFQSLTLQPNP